MGDKSSSDRACKDANPIIDGRKANVNLAILGAKPRGNVQTSKLLFWGKTSVNEPDGLEVTINWQERGF
jgi:hypothetical protein